MSETLYLSAGDTVRLSTYLSASDIWSYTPRTLTDPVTISGNVTLDPSTRVILSASQPDYAPALQSTLLAAVASITGNQTIIISKEDSISGTLSIVISKEDSISASIAALGTPMQAGTEVVLSASQPNYPAALQSTLLAAVASITGNQAIIITKEDNLSASQVTIISKEDSISASIASLGTPMQTGEKVVLSASQPDYTPALQSTLLAAVTSITGNQVIIISKEDSISGTLSVVISKEDSISASIASLGTPMQSGAPTVLSASQPYYAPAKASDVLTQAGNALLNYDSGGGVAKENSVLSIQNNTRFVTSIPVYMLIPIGAPDVYKLVANFYDTSGTMEDPDNDDLAIDIETVGAVSKNAYLFQDYACTSALSASINFPASKAMIKVGIGQYECYFQSVSGVTNDQLIVNFSLKENSEALYYNRTTLLLLEAPGTSILADNATNRDIIAKSLKSQDVSGVSAVVGSIYQDLIDSITSVDTDVVSVSGLAELIKITTDKFLFDVNSYVLSKAVLSANQPDYTPALASTLDAGITAITGNQQTIISKEDSISASVSALGTPMQAGTEVVLSASQPSYPIATETSATLNKNEIFTQISTISADVWNYTTRELTSLSGLDVDITSESIELLRNEVWNSMLEYLDETGTTRQTEAWIMLQAIFSTIKQRLKRK